jgi:hypothetical protein
MTRFQTMPSGGLGDDEDTAGDDSFGTVCHPATLVKPADLQTSMTIPPLAVLMLGNQSLLCSRAQALLSLISLL